MLDEASSKKLKEMYGEENSYSDMSDEERRYFVEILKEEIDRRERSGKAELVRPIVPMSEFLTPYYLGDDAKRIFPYWKDFLCDMFSEDRNNRNKRINTVVLSGSIGTGKSCLNENTRIPASIGNLPLKTLYNEFHNKGKRFKVLSEFGERDCIDVYDNGNDDTKIIETESGRVVEGTLNHKFRVIRDAKIEWVKFSDIREGDYLLMSREITPFGNIHMDYDEAYTLGYMTGDGWCSKSKTKDRYNSFDIMFQYEQTEVAQRICRAWIHWFGKVNVRNKYKLKNGNLMIVLSGYSTDKATKLVESGFGSGAENKGIPEFIFKCDKETVGAYIRGLFDSDGTSEKDGYTYITLKSKNCIKQIADLMSMFGINYRLSESNSKYKYKNKGNEGKFYTLSLRGIESYKRFEDYIGFSIVYKKENLRKKVEKGLKEKNRNDREIVPFAVEELRRLDEERPLSLLGLYKKYGQFRSQDNYTLKALKSLYHKDRGWVSQSPYLQYICENDVFFDKVKSISDGRCHTYDLTIDGEHSYCFDGFISHNTIAEIILLRKLYEISCYKNINSFFGLMQSATITFIYFSLNKATALATGFSSIRAWVDNSTYFNRYFPRRKRLDSILVFPEGVTVAYGSRATASTGRNVLCSIMDEANFLNSMGDNNSGNVEQAVEMFTGLVNRSNSRFILQGGDNFSLNILVSSSTHNNSATERIIKASHDDPHTLVTQPAQWDVKPQNFSKDYFYVLKGTNYMEPQIIESTDDINSFRVSEGLPKSKYVDNLTDFNSIDGEIKKLPPFQQDNFLKVPVDLRRGFEMNIIRSLQDMGGVSTGALGKLFNSPAVFDACIDENLSHPFTSQELVISTGDNVQISDYFKNGFRFKYIERPRFIHIDQSYRTDSTGIACVYVSDIMEDENGIKKPVFSTDFMLRINPPKPPRKIAIYKIRNFIVFLHNVMGLKIGKVTYDIFNSEESRQILEEMGFNVGYLSVDRSDKPYLSLVEIMYEGRLKFYNYPILRHEIFNLIHDRVRRKVDHPKTVGDSSYNGKGSDVGSKDVADGLCGAIFDSLQMSIVDEVDERRTIDDFMRANTFRGQMWEPDVKNAEEAIDKQIDDMIEEMEINNQTYGNLYGIRGF